MKSPLLTLMLSVAVCGTAAAQTSTPKPQPPKPQPTTTKPVKPKKPPRVNPLFFISADVAAQPIGSFSDTVQTTVNAEKQTVTTGYRSGTAVLGGGTFGLLFHKTFGAAVSVSRLSRGGKAHVEASVPHPFFFNQPRQVEGDVQDLTRAETGVNILLMYLPKPGKHLRFVFSGGPSYLNVEQEFVSDVTYSESYPYDTATFSGVESERAKEGAFGFNAGVDVIWMFNKHTGAGALLRYTHATADLSSSGHTVSVTAGGVQAGLGLRIFY